MRRALKILVLMAVLITILVTGALLANASGTFTFSSQRPEPGSTVTTTSATIRAYVVADFNLVGSTARVKIDNTTYTATFTQRYSAKDGFITYNATNLIDGVRNVEVSIQDVNGNTGRNSWTFTVRVPPVISELVPASGSSQQTVSLISAKAIDPNGTIARITMTLNGSTVVPQYNAGTGYITYQPVNLPAGNHSVSLTVEDNSANTSSVTWTFKTTSEPPVFSSANPAPGSTINNFSPNISVRVTDAYSQLDNTTVKMSLSHEGQTAWVTPAFAYDYNTVTKVFDYYKGTISFKPQSLTDGSHTVYAEIKNKAGLTGTYSWSFNVAVPPVIQNQVPANNVVINSVPEVSAVATDSNGAVNQSSIDLKINGQSVAYNYNSSTGKIVATDLGRVAEGTNTVTLSVADIKGNTGTSTWSFTVNTTPPSFSAYAPAAGTTVTIPNPQIKVSIEDPNRINNGTAKLFINNVQQTGATFAYHQYYNQNWQLVTDFTKGTLTFTPEMLINGVHEIRVEAQDEPGNTGTATWSFTVSAAAKVLEISPGPGTTVAVTRPVVTIDLLANQPLTEENVTLTVSGRKVAPVFTSLGNNKTRLTYQPNEEWMTDESVLLQLQVPGSGSPSITNWAYYINIFSEMPGTGKNITTCALCHDGLKVKQNKCGQCHTSSITSWQSKCFDCHLTSTPPTQHHRYDTYPHETISDHQLGINELVGCQSCHSRTLTRAHNRNYYTCGTCHVTDTTPRKPILRIYNRLRQVLEFTLGAQGNKDCFNCHSAVDALGNHKEHKVSHTGACAECHGTSMMEEGKVGHQVDCSTCHGSSDPNVREAIVTQKNSCLDCHTQPHGVYMAVLRDDIPMFSGVSWSIPQNATIWSGEDWLPVELNTESARVLFSSRKPMDVNAVQAWYQNAMTEQGWTLLRSRSGSGWFEITYLKGRRYCAIWLYSGDIPNESGTNPEGSRLQLAYH